MCVGSFRLEHLLVTSVASVERTLLVVYQCVQMEGCDGAKLELQEVVSGFSISFICNTVHNDECRAVMVPSWSCRRWWTS